MFDPSPRPSARSVMKVMGMLSTAKKRAGRSPNFRIIQPSATSAPMTVTPTRILRRYGDIIKRWCLYSLSPRVASRVADVDHHAVRITPLAVVVAFVLIGPLPSQAAEDDVLSTLRKGHPRLLVLDEDIARLQTQIE